MSSPSVSLPPTATRPGRGHRFAAVAAVVIGSLLGVSVVSLWVVQSSRATLSDTTDNAANAWAAGTLTLTDNDAGSAMFNVSNLSPSEVVTRCIQVTFTSSTTPGSVRLYGVAGGTGLADWLDVTIEEGTGGGGAPVNTANCTGFTPTGTIFTGELDQFAIDHTSFATGAGAWAPAASPETITYRITTTVQNDQSVQGLNASATFTWEAQA